MPKNNALINSFRLAERARRTMEREARLVTPQVYAGIALALHRLHGWGPTRIGRLFAESQEAWEECVASGRDMLALCAEETGIELRDGDSEQGGQAAGRGLG